MSVFVQRVSQLSSLQSYREVEDLGERRFLEHKTVFHP
uniref:Uncharacterized protein n=1 Tax=Nelumbo nucifera TaxID=4432 RepID=A0A822YE36_NELNU|nr:TPA_asm: hypothetical protein HUJ06_029206 [Nelumbo nucifera]